MIPPSPNFPMVDSVADTVGGDTAAKLFGKVRNGGSFGYASVIPDGLSKSNPTVSITRVFARPDASKVREFADDVRDGKFLLPISRRLALRDAAAGAHVGDKGVAQVRSYLCARTCSSSADLDAQYASAI
jgi:NADPH:quinone reductase-like Zn-dependent oxidoreductase